MDSEKIARVIDGPNGLKALKIKGLPLVFYRDKTSDSEIIQNNLVLGKEYVFPPVEPNVILDIGANIGILSVMMTNLYPKAKIYAFEPIDSNFEILQMNVEHYPNVKAFPFALGAPGKRMIFDSEDSVNRGGFSLFERGSNKDLAREINVRELDEVLDEIGVEPDMVKIDAEGAEYEILKRLKPSRIENVRWIFGELHGEQDFKLLDYLSGFFDLSFSKPMDRRTYPFSARSRTFKD